jgi:ribonuclease HI
MGAAWRRRSPLSPSYTGEVVRTISPAVVQTRLGLFFYILHRSLDCRPLISYFLSLAYHSYSHPLSSIPLQAIAINLQHSYSPLETDARAGQILRYLHSQIWAVSKLVVDSRRCVCDRASGNWRSLIFNSYPEVRMKQVRIVCDGSSLGNGSGAARAGAAAMLEYQGYRKLCGEYLGNATNQQAEIMAACLGLEKLKEPCQVELVTDSQYVVETMNGRFRRKANLELWRRLDEARRRHQVAWTWTRGHAGHPVQEKCDKAARLIAEMGRVDQASLDHILNQAR